MLRPMLDPQVKNRFRLGHLRWRQMVEPNESIAKHVRIGRAASEYHAPVAERPDGYGVPLTIRDATVLFQFRDLQPL